MSSKTSASTAFAAKVPSWWQVARTSFRRDLWVDGSYRANWFLRILALAFSCASLFFLGRTVGSTSETLAPYGGDYFAFALLGTAFAMVMGSALSATSKRLRELQLLGMLPPIFATPASPLAVTASLALYPLAATTLQVVIYLTLGILAFGASIHLASIPVILVTLILALLAHLALGILSASFVLTLRKSDPISWLIQSLTFLFSGVAYPVDVLPPALQEAARLLPATHALKAIRASASGATADPWPSILALGIFCAVLWPLTSWTLCESLKKALRDGSLDLP